MDIVRSWQYKTLLIDDISGNGLVEQLDHEGIDGWELVTIQAIVQREPEEEGTLPGLASRNLTGDYLVIFKKIRE